MSNPETTIKVFRELRDAMYVEYRCEVRVLFAVDSLMEERIPSDLIAARLVEELRRFVNSADAYEVVTAMTLPVRNLRHCPYCGSEIAGGLS